MFFVQTIRRWLRDRARNIFKYHDGVRTRYADPVAAGTDLETALPKIQEILDTLARSPSEIPPGAMRDDLVNQQRDSIKQLALAARKVFKLSPLDDETGWGATDAQAVGVVIRYFQYMGRLARDAELFANSPVPE
jgi:hypothetical protein